jgi:hypothetical protein
VPARLSILKPMNAPNTWLCHRFLLVLFTTSCAAITPAVTGAPPAQNGTATLEVYEGRPASIVLQLQASDSSAETMELWRSVNGGPAELIQNTQLDQPTRTQIAASGVLLVDAEAPFGTLLYQVVFRVADQMSESTVLKVQWEPGPSSPTLRLESLGTGAVRLRWDQPSQNGCVVFRRDLLTGERPKVLTRMKASCDGLFLDTRVHAAGVYSYRVATSDLSHGFPRYSEPSDETYVTIPEGP